MKIAFEHRQSAHCESGVTANLVAHYGFPMTEAAAFGIGSGLFFCYLPFVKVNRLPLTSFRFLAGGIFKRACRRLGFLIDSRRFRDPARSMDALDRLLDQGVPVGLQVGVFWLPYFPPALRFHFNAHNLVVFGRENNDYLISDPVLEETVACSRADLLRVRFAKGPLAPRGRMYHVTRAPEEIDLKKAIVAGLRETARFMLRIPVPLFGVKGIRVLAKRVRAWPEKLGPASAALQLGQVIRMQEEIGTGGAGFRFLFSAFLQEAAGVLGDPAFGESARAMTEAGDAWRAFALTGARLCKGRERSHETYDTLADRLVEIARREEEVFRHLETLTKKPRQRLSST